MPLVIAPIPKKKTTPAAFLKPNTRCPLPLFTTPQALSKAAAAIKAGAADLSPEQAVDAAWALALLGADAAALAPPLAAAGAAVAAAPDCVPVQALAALCEAQTLALDRLGSNAPKLPEQVYAYAQGMYALASDARAARRPAAEAAFHAAVGAAAARAAGARCVGRRRGEGFWGGVGGRARGGRCATTHAGSWAKSARRGPAPAYATHTLAQPCTAHTHAHTHTHTIT